MSQLLRRHAATRVVIALLTVSSAACGSAAAPSAPITETLTGVVPPASLAFNIFSASAGGDITITLTGLDPLSGISVGIGLGVATTTGTPSCSLAYSQEGLKVGAVWTTSLSNKGSYCVAVYDIGQVTQNVSYSLKVTHP